MLHTTDDATFRMMLEVHTVAPFRLARAAAPYLRIKEAEKRENRSIVMVSPPPSHHPSLAIFLTDTRTARTDRLHLGKPR